jgi:hypothetical protein
MNLLAQILKRDADIVVARINLNELLMQLRPGWDGNDLRLLWKL